MKNKLTEFTNLVEKEMLKSPVSNFIPAFVYVSGLYDVNFVLTQDGGFVTTHRDYKFMVKQVIRLIQNN